LNDKQKCRAPNNSETSFDDITVELVDKNIRSLKIVKTCGSDGLNAEHLIYAHVIVVLLTHLFRSMALHSFVPSDFGKGLIVPLIKDEYGDPSDLNNYRAITL
jgi:hypothetical protein